MPPELATIFETLVAAIREVHDGDLDPRQAQAMSSLAGAVLRTLETGELDERLRRLEADNGTA
jgi:hypothetical protein